MQVSAEVAESRPCWFVGAYYGGGGGGDQTAKFLEAGIWENIATGIWKKSSQYILATGSQSRRPTHASGICFLTTGGTWFP